MTAKPSAGELREQLKELLRLFKDDFLSVDETVDGILDDVSRSARDAMKLLEKLNILDLLIAADFDVERGHPFCYEDFNYVKFTEVVITEILALIEQPSVPGVDAVRETLMLVRRCIDPNYSGPPVTERKCEVLAAIDAALALIEQTGEKL
jgi:hypothetical protein